MALHGCRDSVGSNSPALGRIRDTAEIISEQRTVSVPAIWSPMTPNSRSERIAEIERHLSETRHSIEERRRTVERLQRLGADSSNAADLLGNLLELQRLREQLLAYLRTLPDSFGGEQ